MYLLFGFNEFLNDSQLELKPIDNIISTDCTLIVSVTRQTFVGLCESAHCFVVVLEFVDLDLGTGLVEARQRFHGFGTCVERYDVFHDFGVFAPVERLQVVRSHYKCLALFLDIRKENHLFRVARLHQRFHRLYFQPHDYYKKVIFYFYLTLIQLKKGRIRVN